MTLLDCNACGEKTKVLRVIRVGSVKLDLCPACHKRVSTEYSEIEVVMGKREEIMNILDKAGLPYSEWDINLILGTAATESDYFKYSRQLGGGPALGYFQCEPSTRKDICDNYLVYRKSLVAQLEKVVPNVLKITDPEFLESFDAQVIFCYTHYKRRKVIGTVHSVDDCAMAWKAKYNTMRGKGKVEDFIEKYHKYVG